ncbi:MAG TPA: hypothetical protein PK459_04025 [Anaerolineaceae bacterium]|nr:hypothetical protein [Anaerolineaceae bacterium]
MIEEAYILKLIQDVQSSRKYRDLDLPNAFLRDLIESECQYSKNKKVIKDNFRKKLHEVIAPYLEVIDYYQETKYLLAEYQQNSLNNDQIKKWARSIMQKHASTRERLANLEGFYQTIWSNIGYPSSIIDLACALDPLALPWFNNSSLNAFYAVDIHKPRLEFLETYFQLFFPFAKTIQQDFIAEPIQIKADCALLFKEAHRMEKRKSGSTSQLIQNLDVQHIVISLPAKDLSGHHDLSDFHTRLIENAIQGQNLSMTMAQVGLELLYFIEKL